MKQVIRTVQEIVDLLDDIQNDALNAEGCTCALHYNTEDGQKWIDWLTGKIASYD